MGPAARPGAMAGNVMACRVECALSDGARARIRAVKLVVSKLCRNHASFRFGREVGAGPFVASGRRAWLRFRARKFRAAVFKYKKVRALGRPKLRAASLWKTGYSMGGVRETKKGEQNAWHPGA